MALEDTFRVVPADAWLPRAATARPEHPAVGRLTYAELLDRARAGARDLRARGVRDRVRIDLPPGEDFAVALHAAWLLGAAVATAGEPTVDAPLGDGPAGAPLPERFDPGAPALLLRTSGTAGAPKDVALSFGNLLWSALGAAVALGRDPADRWLCCLPLTHVGGLSILSRSVVWQTTAEVHARFDAERVLRRLRAQDGPTLVSLVPTTLRRLLDAGLERPPALRVALLGGAAAPPALVRRARAAGVPVVRTYGMTEAASMVAVEGRPLFCTRVREQGGELVVAGPTVAGGVHRTGDRGIVAPDGAVTVLGRLDDLIITGGENVAPDAVEAVLAEHAAVADAAVVGRPDPEWGQAVTAVVVRRAGVTADELRSWCAGRLPRHAVPKTIRFTDRLPRNAAGKVLRGELQ